MSMPAEFMHPQPTLADLLDGYADAPPLRIQGIASDSRYLDEGYLFLAVQGLTSHGLDFLAEALEAGVSAVAWDASMGTPPRDVGIPVIAVDNLASRLGEIANRDCAPEQLAQTTTANFARLFGRLPGDS